MSYSRHTWPWSLGNIPWPLLTLRFERASAVAMGVGSRFVLPAGNSDGEPSREAADGAGAAERAGGGERSFESLWARTGPSINSGMSAGRSGPQKARWKRAVIEDLPPPNRNGK